jgi:RNA polymerase-binding transcription factor DksA
MADAGSDGLADLAREESERQTRDAIDAALRSLPEGESDGICQDCRSDIETARLALLSGTTQCSACARTRAKFSGSASLN